MVRGVRTLLLAVAVAPACGIIRTAAKHVRKGITMTQVEIDQARLAEFCRRWKVTELAQFGSSLRDDFGPTSDVDLLVTFSRDADWSLFDHFRMEQELADMLGREVDLVSRRGIEGSRNWIRRREILRTARTIYAA